LLGTKVYVVIVVVGIIKLAKKIKNMKRRGVSTETGGDADPVSHYWIFAKRKN
jgi:hypothetical protein